MRQGVATFQALGSEEGRPLMLAQLAEGYLDMGRAEQSLSPVAEALAVAHHTGQLRGEAELYRIQGALLWVQSWEHYAEVEACVRHAFVTHHQEAKSLELRAAMSLSRLWQQQRKCTDAYQLLALIYGWFTEGFDTGDLQEAKALLAGLS